MSLLVVGLSHRSAPVEVLDRAALTGHDVEKLLADVQSSEFVTEAAVVATCNRIEVYADVAKFHGGVEETTELLSRHCGVPLEDLTAHLYVHHEDRAVQHLFSVASGLDSMVTGESQILGQVREALHTAHGADTVGTSIGTLFQQALRVGKRAHSETGIDSAGRSLVTVGLAVLADAVGPIEGKRALVVGAGSMASLAAATLARLGAVDVVVANRTYENAARIAATVGGRTVPLNALADVLAEVDVVVSCTGASDVVLSTALVSGILEQRAGRPLGVLDLAMPHDVDPGVGLLPGVTRADLSTISEVALSDADGPAAVSSQDVLDARAIVDAEVEGYVVGQRAALAAPTVKALRTAGREIAAVELGRLSGRLGDVDPRVLDEVSHTLNRMVDKLLHGPTLRVKELATQPGGETYTKALRELFALDPRTTRAVESPEPATDEPATDEPATDEPATDGPATDGPDYHEPTAEQVFRVQPGETA